VPGFGSGPFGKEPFGEWEWSKAVLFGLIPGVYQDKDAVNGGLLESFIDGLRDEFDKIKTQIENYGNIRDPLKSRTKYDEVFSYKLGKQIIVEGEIEQRGLDGSVTSVRNFATKTGRFRAEDIGKTITISRASVPTNNRTVSIARVIDSQTVVTDPLLALDTNVLLWELRSRPPPTDGFSRFEIRSGDASPIRPGWFLSDGIAEFEIAERKNFPTRGDGKHLTEREGRDGAVDAFGRLTSPSARFSQLDVGKKVSLSGSSITSNNGWSEIVFVQDANTAATSLLEIQGTAAQASLIVPGSGPDGGVSYTAITPGDAGNAITVTHIQTGILTALSVTVTGTAISVTLATDGAGAISSTANDVALAVNTYAPAAALVQAVGTGTGLSLAGAIATTHLFGGLDYGTVRYFLRAGASNVRVNQVHPGAPLSPLSLTVAGSDINISLGTDVGGSILSTGIDIVSLINNNLAASALVSATTQGLGNGPAGATSDFLPVIGVGLGTDPGPFFWAILPYPVLALSGSIIPKGVVGQDGNDGSFIQVTPTVLFSAPSAKFTPDYVGAVITLRGSINPINNASFTIVSVLGTTLVSVTPINPGTPIKDVNLFWEVRTPSSYSDRLTTTAHSPSILQYLAQDFGIEVDSHENAIRQQGYVYHCNQWFDLKGTEKSYEILGALSGVSVTPHQLYRITKEIWPSIPAGDKYEVPESGPGKSGAVGTLSVDVDFKVIFTSTEAKFGSEDIGRNIKIEGSSAPGNNKYYTIDTILSGTSVKMVFGDTATTPDTLSGTGTRWSVVRLYSDLAPTRPLYDEINSDELSTWVLSFLPGKVFSVDKYCWEPDFAAYVNVTVNSATLDFFGNYILNVTGPADVIASVGHWELQYADGTDIFVETVPATDGLGNFTFQVDTTSAPSLGAAKLQYVCDPQLSCDFCGSNRVIALIDYDPSKFSAFELENLEDRIASRLNQVVPIHVELISLFRVTHTATIAVSSILIASA